MLAGQDTLSLGHTASVPNRDDVPNALHVLQQNAIKQKKVVGEYDANFATSLANYRNKVTSNTPLPEEANKYKVQAEGAVRDKQFDDAVDYYAKALRIAPWWPAGHFNRALVLGEAGDYEIAMREMKYYLQLAPDAPNARAAQDKIYDWERLESKQELHK
jgi:tetratricopeptide (TPR) repeat protein